MQTEQSLLLLHHAADLDCSKSIYDLAELDLAQGNFFAARQRFDRFIKIKNFSYRNLNDIASILEGYNLNNDLEHVDYYFKICLLAIKNHHISILERLTYVNSKLLAGSTALFLLEACFNLYRTTEHFDNDMLYPAFAELVALVKAQLAPNTECIAMEIEEAVDEKPKLFTL
jgi:hypothetical protein